MTYGKVTCAIDSEHGRLHVTVTGEVTSLKQGNDLIRLTLDEAASWPRILPPRSRS